MGSTVLALILSFDGPGIFGGRALFQYELIAGSMLSRARLRELEVRARDSTEINAPPKSWAARAL